MDAKRLLERILHPVRPRLVGPDYLILLATRRPPRPTDPIDTEWGGRNPRWELVQDIRDAGFERVEPSWWGHSVVFDSAEDFWDAQTAIVTLVRKRLMEASPGRSGQSQASVPRRAEAILRRSNTLIYPYGTFHVSAIR